MTNIRWKDKSDITTLAGWDKIPVTDISDSNADKYTTPAEIATYVAWVIPSWLSKETWYNWTYSYASASTITSTESSEIEGNRIWKLLEWSLFACKTVATSVTADSTTDKITLNSHWMLDYTPIIFGGTAVPWWLTAWQVYYVRDSATNDFKVASSITGSAIDITSNWTSVTIQEVKYWYIKSASASWTTLTYTVITNRDLSASDTWFRIAPNRKVQDYEFKISIPWEVVADASNPQWVWYLDLKYDWYLLPVNATVRTAAAWSWAACSYNIYNASTAMFTTAPDLTTNQRLIDQRLTSLQYISNDWNPNNISLRIIASAGATNKASDFQAQLYIVPAHLYAYVS